ncbi:F-box only protein 42 [Podila epicladia]|nr:F-box only protein 42 [Podila epicladia]
MGVSQPFTANAQSFQPLVAYGASSVFIEGKAMYVTGGHSGASNLSQTFSLDLSSPWTITAPKFTRLNSVRSPSDYQIPSALDKDQIGWLIVSGTQAYRYDVSQNLWSTFDTLTNLFPADKWYLQATVDPVSNNFLIPNGFITPTATGVISSMMQYDIVSGRTSSISMANGPIDHAAASVVWSRYLKKLVMFGGLLGNDTFNSLHTYDSASGWAAITPTNPGPSPRAYHCAVVANNGTKMVVFGGITDIPSNTVSGDIYVLDLTTWAWSVGTPLSSDLARANTACGATGDYFVSWGGSRVDNIIVSSNITLLFNIKTMSWTDSFVPPPTPPEEKKSKVAMIAGIAAGVVVLLAIVGFIFYRQSKRSRDGKNKNGKDGGEAGGVTVVPISAIDANHIWQPPTLVAQPDPSTPVVDPYTLQQHHHQPVYDHHQQPVYDQHQQQQPQYLSYDQQQPPNNWPSPTVHTGGSPAITGYSSTAYSPYQQQQQQQQQHQYTDGAHAYKGDEGYIPPPVVGGNFRDEYKVEHTPENPNRTSVNYNRGPQAPQQHGDSPPKLEDTTPSGVIVRNSYAE